MSMPLETRGIRGLSEELKGKKARLWLARVRAFASLETGHSIRSRLHRLVLVSVGLALMAFAFLDVWQGAQSYLLDRREAMLATANVVGAASADAVATANIPEIRDSLRSIARLPGFQYAKVVDSHGRTLAEVGATEWLDGGLTIDVRDGGSLYDLLKTRRVAVVIPVIKAGRPVGELLLIGGTGDLLPRFLKALRFEALGAILVVAIGLLFADRMQKSITRPLSDLTAGMSRIAKTHDFSTSLPGAADRETKALAESFNTMMAEIRSAYAAITDREAELIFRLSRATEKRDNETGEHIVRMAALCRLVGQGLHLEERELEALQRVAPLHDVGKIGVPDVIMHKPGKLDAAERREMERHTTYGYEILRGSKSTLIRLAAEMAWSHHERWEGTGYPRGLKGAEIPLPGRIAAVADVCDALASARPYKPAWSLARVKAHLIENSGTHFDPACVEALLANWAEVERIYAAPGVDRFAPKDGAATDRRTESPVAAGS